MCMLYLPIQWLCWQYHGPNCWVLALNKSTSHKTYTTQILLDNTQNCRINYFLVSQQGFPSKQFCFSLNQSEFICGSDWDAGRRTYVHYWLVYTLSSCWEEDYPLKHLSAIVCFHSSEVSLYLLHTSHTDIAPQSHVSHLKHSILTLVCIYSAVLKGLSPDQAA